jgi:MbtH protein
MTPVICREIPKHLCRVALDVFKRNATYTSLQKLSAKANGRYNPCGSIDLTDEKKGSFFMSENENEATKTYLVVVNHEEQYSIWLPGKEIPAGWHEAGKSGTKDECLSYISDVWTDMRPLSLRQKMDKAAS